ncbi:hypothetical protein SAMN04488074_13521 [Lentzea albidocapillata subsp. violacea]|uniref:Uncharacterized protein n=1 Tax=Lentzea albidocapillata subsp. violacea TaxID=128104 RepID=A0A1G9YU70_9PSEU|nr:hypothetical protein [Lentzea albidocapillata]SDN11896.1 hypothetical protein SAMN04488074_13521 [Lentzea albidocapillata subsp. violacea]
MSDQIRIASPEYATGQLARALAAAVSAGTEADRERALRKSRRWEDIVSGMAGGVLTVGSRTPVADTPAWVTLEVAHGGFATGRYLAEVPLSEDETARVASLPDEVPGSNKRERLNLWYLGDDGQAELLDAVRAGRFRVELPEDAALPVVALLLDKGFPEQALDLVAELRPLMHRLRLTPRFEPIARPSDSAVRVASVRDAVASLRAVRVPEQIAKMRATLTVWDPLYDRLVALWCRTVDGEPPRLGEDGSVHGGWPCRTWPVDWAEARARWLADFADMCRTVAPSGRQTNPKSNFAVLRRALESCSHGSDALTAREVGRIRRAIANTVSSRGAPAAAQRSAWHAAQTAAVTAPTNAALADVLASRLDRFPADGGLPSLDVATTAVSEAETTAEIPCGTTMPDSLVRKAARALEAPADELVRLGVITSGETLAVVLPQLTSRLLSAAIDDPVVAGLHEQIYTAFRRRRGLLLLNLEHQVQFTELPWVQALAPCRSPQPDNAAAAHRALRQITMLALTAFPHALLPNPLVTEIRTLAKQAELHLPLVEEVAADIFMGTFTTKWRAAAAVASRLLSGTLYANYYDLPANWSAPQRTLLRWGKKTAADFTELCRQRAGTSGGSVAANGMLLEQSQILTTHNLAVLVDALDLTDELRERAPGLAGRTLSWIVRRQAQRADHLHAALIQVKNTAYAWRQALFLLSFCEPTVQMSLAVRFSTEVRDIRLVPAAEGLLQVLEGDRFTPAGTMRRGKGRRFLGWAEGTNPFLFHASGKR